MAYNSNCANCQQHDQQFQRWMVQQKPTESTNPDIVGSVSVQEACLACEQEFDLLNEEGRNNKREENMQETVCGFQSAYLNFTLATNRWEPIPFANCYWPTQFVNFNGKIHAFQNGDGASIPISSSARQTVGRKKTITKRTIHYKAFYK